MAAFHSYTCLSVMLVCQCLFASVSVAAEISHAPVDRATFAKLIDAAATPMDNASFLQLLRAEKRCHDPGAALARYYPSCRDRLLSALDMLDKPSNALLVEALNWYWSSKKRTGADEMMQRRLFNQLQSPLFRTILMENRYLQTAVEFRAVQYRLDPYARESWSMHPVWGHAQSVNELFQLTYALPEETDAFGDGYLHQDQIYGFAEHRRLSGRSDLNRLLGHVISFVGEDLPGFSRTGTPRIPDNADYWDTLRRFDRRVFRVRWKALMQPLEDSLKEVSKIYAQWLQFTPGVEAMHRPGQAKIFIEYLRYRDTRSGQDHYAAFSLSALEPGATTRFVDLGSAQKIDALVDGLRRRILQQTDIDAQRKQLTALLLKPLSIDFSNIDEVVISPVASLNRLPFSLLVQGEGNDGILVSFNDRWSILVQQFWREAGLDRDVETSPGIVLAAPAYGGNLKTVSADLDVAGLERKGATAWPRFFTPLAYTLQEGKAIKALSPGSVDLLTGEDASEFALFERDHPDFIHIASHGYFLSGDWQRQASWPVQNRTADEWFWSDPGVLPRLDSGLALAGANQLVGKINVEAFRQDGLFTASDAASLNLLGTRLVVLSACDTGLGRIASNQPLRFGDGVSDLRTAFRLAGAQNVVMSLWPVADRTTAQFMEAFYANWFSGMDPHRALRSAQMKMRESRHKPAAEAHPYYWAGFVIQKDY